MILTVLTILAQQTYAFDGNRYCQVEQPVVYKMGCSCNFDSEQEVYYPMHQVVMSDGRIIQTKLSGYLRSEELCNLYLEKAPLCH